MTENELDALLIKQKNLRMTQPFSLVALNSPRFKVGNLIKSNSHKLKSNIKLSISNSSKSSSQVERQESKSVNHKIRKYYAHPQEIQNIKSTQKKKEKKQKSITQSSINRYSELDEPKEIAIR